MESTLTTMNNAIHRYRNKKQIAFHEVRKITEQVIGEFVTSVRDDLIPTKGLLITHVNVGDDHIYMTWDKFIQTDRYIRVQLHLYRDGAVKDITVIAEYDDDGTMLGVFEGDVAITTDDNYCERDAPQRQWLLDALRNQISGFF